MAKVSKELLKEIVKECLVEILAEGLTGGSTTQLSESIETVSPRKTRKSPSSRIMKNMLPSKKVVNEKFEENTRQVISRATKDPVMAELLADTAKTTLQEQNASDQPNKFTAQPLDAISRTVAESDPTELFGEAASSWAQLAFAGNAE